MFENTVFIICPNFLNFKSIVLIEAEIWDMIYICGCGNLNLLSCPSRQLFYNPDIMNLKMPYYDYTQKWVTVANFKSISFIEAEILINVGEATFNRLPHLSKQPLDKPNIVNLKKTFLIIFKVRQLLQISSL